MAIILDDDLVCCRGAGRPRQQGELPGGDRGRDGGLHRLLGLLPQDMELNQTFFLVWKVNCISVHKLYDVLLMFLLISRKNVSSFLPEALTWSRPGPRPKKKKHFLAKNRRG